MKCGHLEPSTEDTSFRANPNLSFSKEYSVQLNNDDKAELDNKNVLITI